MMLRSHFPAASSRIRLLRDGPLGGGHRWLVREHAFLSGLKRRRFSRQGRRSGPGINTEFHLWISPCADLCAHFSRFSSTLGT